jgi:type 1 glutamine amidotransferase
VAGTGRVLAVTGGHRYDEAAFTALLDAACSALGWEYEHVEHPDPRASLGPLIAHEYDAVLLHDLPGLRLARGTEPAAAGPSEELRLAIAELLDAGIGIVATHHALAGWPAWDGWAGALGGRFLYAPGTLRGEARPASGYRFGTYRVAPFGSHPITAGVEPFELTDELYLCPVFERDITPVLATDADIAPPSMVDAYREVVSGERAPAPCQDGSPFVGWVHAAGRSPVAYLLPGHTAETMAHPMYRRIVTNALAWVASPAAHAWAAAVGQPVDARS